MNQVLFNIPVLKNIFPPNGMPIYTGGVIVMPTFLAVYLVGIYCARRIGMNAKAVQYYMVWSLIAGVLVARILS
jgi:prolipoprotein diacylglyceryltransferase